jgi:asparagine synthase (glutamine-hydrolysing)
LEGTLGVCGINGVFAYHIAASNVDGAEIVRVRDRMAARGPDGEGLWIAPDRRVGLGHRRLAIIDLSERGRQPMSVDGGNTLITFNGEIYNFRALRQDLEQRGHVFTSQSDTEVLLRLYADRGEDMVRELQGMFAFALWDARARKLILVRDPYGIKPLYYADDGWTVRFASQARALLAGEGISADLEPAGVVGFYLFGSVPEPFTLWRDIQAVPAGTIVTVDEIGVSAPKSYCNLAAIWARKNEGVASGNMLPGAAIEALRGALLDSVRSHLVADVPVGIFLSAGLDSGALLGLMRDAGYSDIQAVTLAFDEFSGTVDDETPLASRVAALYNAKHHVRRVTQKEFIRDLPVILEAMDQPSIDGINTWFVAKAAKEAGLKVALSGLGADELFGGYSTFHDIPRLRRLFGPLSLVPGLGKSSRLLLSNLLPRLAPNLSPKAAGLVEYSRNWAGAWLLRRSLFMPWELGQFLDDSLVREGLHRLRLLGRIGECLDPDPGDSFSTVSTLESSLYMRNQLLRDSDWAGMAHGIEIRVPYVDVKLFSAIPPPAALQAVDAKRLLAKLPRTELPSITRARPKTGFSVPVGQWLKTIGVDLKPIPSSSARSESYSREWSRQLWPMADWAGQRL